MADLACIGCGKALVRRAYRGFPIDECPACGGAWLAEATIEALLFTAENRSLDFQAERLRGENLDLLMARPCPECRAGMKRFSVGPGRIAVDRCPDHGAWLDRGELKGLEATAEGEPPPAPGQPPAPRRWTCPSCGERMDFEFTNCWKCQSEAPESVRGLVGPRPPVPIPVPPRAPQRSGFLNSLGWVLAVGVPIAIPTIVGGYYVYRGLGRFNLNPGACVVLVFLLLFGGAQLVLWFLFKWSWLFRRR